MSTSALGNELGDLILSVTGGDGVRSMFGTVVAGTTTTATVQPDATDNGTMGPLNLLAGKATVGARVLCLYLPDNRVWVVIGK